MAATPLCVADTLDCLDELAAQSERVSVGSIMDAFGTRSYGPMIMMPALLELTPVGAIPGVPTFLAVTIMVVAAQKMIGRPRPWLPGVLGNRTVSADKLGKASVKLRPLADRMDRVFTRRLKFMTRAPFAQIAAGMVIILCLTVPLLEVLPFASSVPMITIAAFGLAVLVRDGVAMIAALAVSVGALGMGLDLWDGGLSDTAQVDGMVDQQMVDDAQQGAMEAGEAVSAASEELGEVAGEVGEEIGQAAEDAGEDIGQAAEDAGDRTADALGTE
ncbi:exopolysaccharide biosynthesis protein [Parerythrobacter aurantius]|uniref:exopolysaccharide biosynthesis protein n=1 Tax=Parerythrobacter aurantius TaxID=3127706 RepID=UPI003254735D